MMDFSCFFTPFKLVFVSFKNECSQEGDILKLDMLKGQNTKRMCQLSSGAVVHELIYSSWLDLGSIRGKRLGESLKLGVDV